MMWAKVMTKVSMMRRWMSGERRAIGVGAGLLGCGGIGAMVLAGKERGQGKEQQSREELQKRMAAGAYTVPSRAAQQAALRGTSPANPLDILVIGGGATGTGVALDAASRGLKVGLVEREDFASGTSSRSTKLIHGGVRYLEKAVFQLDRAQLGLVFHALDERARLIQNAPHLCRSLPTMTPCYSWWEVPYYWSGLKLYDLVAGSQMLHLSKYYSPKESLESFPTLATEATDGRKLKGTVVYYDGQMDDARVNVSLACTAALAGALVLNHAEATSIIKEEASGKVVGAGVKDKLSGDEFPVYSKVVVNAGGPFCDSLRKLADGESRPMVAPSSGVHVVLPDYYSPESMGLIVPKTKDGRVVFVLPWLGRTVAGTTDSKTEITALPRPREEEIQFILEAIGDYLSVNVRRSDVLSAWSGIRPLASDPLAAADGKTENLLRDHVVCVEPHGMVTIAGGKWTTYRSMAQDAVDAAVKAGKLEPVNGTLTKDLKLVGGEGYEACYFAKLAQSYVRMKKSQDGTLVPGLMDTMVAKHLAKAYGTMADRVARIASEEGLGKRLAHGHDYLEAEVAYCARNEYCETAVDFVARRSRLVFLDTEATRQALPRVVDILAKEKQWNEVRRRQEMEDALVFLETFKAAKEPVQIA